MYEVERELERQMAELEKHIAEIRAMSEISDKIGRMSWVMVGMRRRAVENDHAWRRAVIATARAAKNQIELAWRRAG